MDILLTAAFFAFLAAFLSLRNIDDSYDSEKIFLKSLLLTTDTLGLAISLTLIAVCMIVVYGSIAFALVIFVFALLLYSGVYGLAGDAIRDFDRVKRMNKTYKSMKNHEVLIALFAPLVKGKKNVAKEEPRFESQDPELNVDSD